uniref:Uncharacterized protein n=1 Tax=Leersia perrieri TaxID=77586 RepID=A0A0D9XRB6_9ORYZ
MALKQKGTDSAAAAADPKKRRPVGFSGIATDYKMTDFSREENESLNLFFSNVVTDGKVISNDASIDQDLADQLKIFELILFKLGK